MAEPDNPTRRLAHTLAWGALPEPGLITAGQPTEADLAACAAEGIRTVIDLRPPEDDRGFTEPESAARLGLAYHCIPVTPDTLSDAQFDAVRAALTKPGDRPVLMHCRSANRVGALLYPYLVLDAGYAPDAAFDIACAVGLRNAGYAEQAIAYVTARA